MYSSAFESTPNELTRRQLRDTAQIGGVLAQIRCSRLAVRADRQRDRPDAARDEIREEVPAAAHGAERAAAIDEAAGDRLPDASGRTRGSDR